MSANDTVATIHGIRERARKRAAGVIDQMHADQVADTSRLTRHLAEDCERWRRGPFTTDDDECALLLARAQRRLNEAASELAAVARIRAGRTAG